MRRSGRLTDVLIWNRTPERAEALAARFAGRAYAVRVTTDLEAAVRAADAIVCATLSSEPLVHGAWLKAGAHLNMVGAFTPQMRECDDEAVTRARLYADTREGVLKEAGDFVLPIEAGVIDRGDIVGDLASLCRGEAPGRRSRRGDHAVQVGGDGATGFGGGEAGVYGTNKSFLRAVRDTTLAAP